MARARGHMRRRKARMSTQTLNTAMAIGHVTVADKAPADTESAEGFVEFNILDLLRTEPDETAVPAAYNDPASVFTGAPAFPSDRYVFGLIRCSACHNEMIYYQDRVRLSAGYAFRCRICQHALLARLP
jgi:hypothetical protein